MKIVFAGTPEFSLPTLHVLLDSPHEVLAVYTRPDRPRGRGQRTAESPVKRLARRHAIPVCQPGTLRDSGAQATLDAFRADLMIVVAYGLILPPAVLAMSMLPSCRAGAARPRSSGPSWPATGKRESASCRWMPAWIPGRCLPRLPA
jgi:methionyl-tRNA formyltransferase